MYRAECQVSRVKSQVPEKDAPIASPHSPRRCAVSHPALIRRVLTNFPKSIDPIRRLLP